ncbi:MAG: PadR family transcriptional regulator [Microbacterium sp.]
MSVRLSLLAILDQGPCYGYQLRAEFHRRTGAVWPVNVGQIYNTLERLERDGLVARDGADDSGHVFWRITGAGSAEAAAWFAAPTEQGAGARDDLAIKVAIAVTLPGADAAEVVRTQRRAAEERRRARAGERGAGDAPEDIARDLIVDALRFRAEAEERWLDHVDDVLRARPADARALALATDRPRRGRPARRREPDAADGGPVPSAGSASGA